MWAVLAGIECSTQKAQDTRDKNQLQPASVGIALGLRQQGWDADPVLSSLRAGRSSSQHAGGTKNPEFPEDQGRERLVGAKHEEPWK